MGIEAAIVAGLAIAAAGTGHSISSGIAQERRADEALSKQNREQDQAKKDAITQRDLEAQTQSDILMKSKRRQGEREAMDYAGLAAEGGPAGTMLTGPTGVSADTLQLGRSSLLGG